MPRKYVKRRPAWPDAFWSRVEKGEANDCWPWRGYRMPSGHGRVSWNGRLWLAHRVAFTLTHGDPLGLVCHTCDNPPCCNPAHLYDGDDATNARDREERHRRRAPRGEGHCRAVLTEAVVREIRRRHAAGKGYMTVAYELGIPKHLVAQVVTGKTWRHVT